MSVPDSVFLELRARVEQLERELAVLASRAGGGRPKVEHPHALHPLDGDSWNRIYGSAGHDGKAPVNGGHDPGAEVAFEDPDEKAWR